MTKTLPSIHDALSSKLVYVCNPSTHRGREGKGAKGRSLRLSSFTLQTQGHPGKHGSIYLKSMLILFMYIKF